MASHIPHPHSSSHKAAGYAFSLNLVRSLGLWSPNASFPSDVQKPAYLCLTPNNSVDWPEQLRKYLKHNSDRLAQIRAATTRLELLVWRAAEQRTSKSKYLEVQKRRFDRRRRTAKRSQAAHLDQAASGHSDAAAFASASSNGNAYSHREQLPFPPDELLVKANGAREEIRRASQEVHKAIANDKDSSEVNEAHIILALALYAIGDYAGCLNQLPAEQAEFVSRSNAVSHDLDLQVLAILLRGMSLEQMAPSSQADGSGLQQAVATYRALPMSPPPPIPEAQRYVEMGLARLAILDGFQSLDSHRQYFTLTSSFKSVSPSKKLVMYRSYLSILLDQLQSVARVGHDDSGDSHPDTTDVFPMIRAYEQLLYANPSLARFPRAGEATPNMYEYMDIMFAYWDLGILPGKFVVDSLHRALSKTYACQRLHRYLVVVCSTLSFIENDRGKGKEHAFEAIRNLRLYIALFEKSRETDQQAVQEELRRYRKDHGEISSSGGEETDEEGMVSTSGSRTHNPTERDEDFCRVACIGTRLLLTESKQDGKQEQEDDRIDLVHEALGIIEKAKKITEHKQSRKREKDKITGQDGSEKPTKNASSGNPTKEQLAIRSEVLTWLGVARAEWALAEADPEQSRDRAKTALADLQSAVELLPSPAAPSTPMHDAAQMPKQPSELTRALKARALYCLAYAQLEARDVASAIVTAKQAIDCSNSPGSSTETSTHTFTMCDNLKIWHLFVLALTARKDWTRAQEVTSLALYGEQNNAEDDDEDTPENNVASSPMSPKSPPALSDEDAPRPPGPTRQFTRADAPYDPSATGTNASALPTAKPSSSPARKPSPNSNAEDATSSFVNVQLPNGSDESPATGTSVSIGRTRSPSIAVSTQGSTAGRFAERRTEPMTLRTTSPWDDLEAEIDFMITRNKCIEAVEGPELALQDLQANVFTRFSKKRDDLEAIVESRAAEDTYGQSPRSAVSASTYPYPSSSMQQDNARLQQQLDEFSHHQSTQQSHGRARSLLGSISLRHHRSRANTARQERSGTIGSITHLAVPESGSTRPGSVRSVASSGGAVSGQTNGIVTGATPTSARSSGQGEHAGNAAASPAPRPLPAQAARILSRLWLTSAATFRRWGKLEECKGAINEAEDVAGDIDPDIWMQYALYLKTVGDDKDDIAHLAMSKALGMCTDHIPTCLLISKTHLDRGNWAIAEGFLDTATQANAWDSPEAWYLLAKVYENTRRRQRARECLLYALELEKTRPIRELRATLPRFI